MGVLLPSAAFGAMLARMRIFRLCLLLIAMALLPLQSWGGDTPWRSAPGADRARAVLSQADCAHHDEPSTTTGHTHGHASCCQSPLAAQPVVLPAPWALKAPQNSRHDARFTSHIQRLLLRPPQA
ncbi:hypothetical protein THUN1379_03030 [Paludibacterium sp. THUN1379]|uniref:hypothetical protein n=1 Tax=Paludibacterium sp. THUN1379 TaxID=3112107 RepID=UPI0030883C39|nr:hypothetical protein THUN1379_03030 [Paludibacterium sp. THUN1379]